MARPEMFCPKCRERRKMTLHHIRPKRFYGKKGNHMTFLLCRSCHDDLERLIPQHRRLTKDQYIIITLRFLEDTKPSE